MATIGTVACAWNAAVGGYLDYNDVHHDPLLQNVPSFLVMSLPALPFTLVRYGGAGVPGAAGAAEARVRLCMCPFSFYSHHHSQCFLYQKPSTGLCLFISHPGIAGSPPTPQLRITKEKNLFFLLFNLGSVKPQSTLRFKHESVHQCVCVRVRVRV